MVMVATRAGFLGSTCVHRTRCRTVPVPDWSRDLRRCDHRLGVRVLPRILRTLGLLSKTGSPYGGPVFVFQMLGDAFDELRKVVANVADGRSHLVHV